jgi:hypothetical protein
MLSEKIMSVSKVLSELGGQVGKEQWKLLSRAKAELNDAAELAQELEGVLEVPQHGFVPYEHEAERARLEMPDVPRGEDIQPVGV